MQAVSRTMQMPVRRLRRTDCRLHAGTGHLYHDDAIQEVWGLRDHGSLVPAGAGRLDAAHTVAAHTACHRHSDVQAMPSSWRRF